MEHGFINQEGTLSRQIDILTYDNQLFSPLYRINNIVVIPNVAVLHVVEVKTTVNSNVAFHDIIRYFEAISPILGNKTKNHLFIYNSAPVQRLCTYFQTLKHKGDYQKFDHDTFQYLPDAITGINSTFHLRKDYVIFDRDAKGYLSYHSPTEQIWKSVLGTFL